MKRTLAAICVLIPTVALLVVAAPAATAQAAGAADPTTGPTVIPSMHNDVSRPLTALVGACLGGGWGERWHTRLVERAADPNVGRGASARVAAGDRLRGDSGMVDVGERLGTLPAPAEEHVDAAAEQEPVRSP